MTKREIIEELFARCKGLSRRQSEASLNAMFNAMTYALARGERIEIRGFGTFDVRERDARDGRNPRTGTPIKIKAKKIPFFRAGKELRQRVNGTPL